MIDSGINGQIGYIVWWDFRLKGREPMWMDVRSWALTHGLDDSRMPVKENAATFSATCRTYTFGKSKDRLRILEAGKAKDKKGNVTSVTFAIERTIPREVNDQWIYDVDPTIIDRLTYTKASNEIACEKSTQEGMQVKAEAERMFLLADITYVRTATMRLLDSARSFPLRDSGGIYFVPQSAGELLQHLGQVLPTWGDSELHVVPTHSDGSQAVGSAAAEHFWGEVVKLQEDMQELLSGGRARRASTFRERLGRYAEISDRVHFYSELLGMAQEKITGGLTELERQCRDAINEKL